ncbi:MAG TPA: hypothetical protein VHW03_01490 [Chthoniobacterales bacterium]|jgi:hypothetical protein|nr:hypothetical protein [Chthoniobacterales bacterium]
MRLASFFLRPCLTSAAAVAVLFVVGNCATPRQIQTPLAKPNGPIVVGKIAIVNEERHFVLIDLGSFLSVPEPGTALRAVNAAGEIAHLRASPEQQRPFVAADIIDGQPSVGDQVLR